MADAEELELIGSCDRVFFWFFWGGHGMESDIRRWRWRSFLVGLRITPPSLCWGNLLTFIERCCSVGTILRLNSKPPGLVEQPFYTWMMAILRITSIKTFAEYTNGWFFNTHIITTIYIYIYTYMNICHLHLSTHFLKTEIPTFKIYSTETEKHFFYTP